MEYLHLIRNEDERELVQRIARNDPTMTKLEELCNFDANVSLALGHALIGNTHLQELFLTDLELTEEAAHALAQGMAQSNIEEIHLIGNCREHPSHESASSQGSVCHIFYRGIQSSQTILDLSLFQSLTDDPGDAWKDALLKLPAISIRMSDENSVGYTQAFSDVLSRTTVLRELYVELELLETDDMTILAHGLRQNTSLTALRFDFGYHEDVQLLFAQGLNPNSAIIKLNLSQCNINDDRIEFLINLWLPNCPMEEFNMPFNEIGPTGAQRLIQALVAHPTMAELNLQYNTYIGYEGLRLIGNELANLQHLTYLDLERCSIWYNHLEAESEEAQTQMRTCQQAGRALIDGIKRNCFITTLDVNGNRFPWQVMAEIKLYTTLNKLGRYLLAADEDHGVAPSVWCHVFVKCQREPTFGKSLVYFYLKEQPTLVQSRPLRKRKRI